MKNNIENNINKWSKPSELFMYELMVIEPNRAANIIADQLFNIFEINIENENSDSKDYIKNNQLIQHYRSSYCASETGSNHSLVAPSRTSL